MNLRDQISAERLPALQMSAQPAAIIHWLLTAQVIIGEAVGLQLTLVDWGMPKDEVSDEPYFGTPRGGGTPRQSSAPPPPPPFATELPPPPVGMPGMEAFAYGGMDAYAPPQVAPPQTAESRGGDLQSAHEEAVANARMTKLRNQGSLVLGGDPSWDALPSARRAQCLPTSSSPYLASPRVSRPGTAQSDAASLASQQASEASSAAYYANQRKHQGSFSFG